MLRQASSNPYDDAVVYGGGRVGGSDDGLVVDDGGPMLRQASSNPYDSDGGCGDADGGGAGGAGAGPISRLPSDDEDCFLDASPALLGSRPLLAHVSSSENISSSTDTTPTVSRTASADSGRLTPTPSDEAVAAASAPPPPPSPLVAAAAAAASSVSTSRSTSKRKGKKKGAAGSGGGLSRKPSAKSPYAGMFTTREGSDASSASTASYSSGGSNAVSPMFSDSYIDSLGIHGGGGDDTIVVRAGESDGDGDGDGGGESPFTRGGGNRGSVYDGFGASSGDNCIDSTGSLQGFGHLDSSISSVQSSFGGFDDVSLRMRTSDDEASDEDGILDVDVDLLASVSSFDVSSISATLGPDTPVNRNPSDGGPLPRSASEWNQP
eukprot:gene17726-7073_t